VQSVSFAPPAVDVASAPPPPLHAARVATKVAAVTAVSAVILFFTGVSLRSGVVSLTCELSLKLLRDGNPLSVGAIVAQPSSWDGI
jgi:hypothetical protein